MVMWTGQNIQAQKMGRQATGEGSLMLRLFETSIPGWLPLRVGKAIQHIPREITMVPCRGFLASAWTRWVDHRSSDREYAPNAAIDGDARPRSLER